MVDPSTPLVTGDWLQTRLDDPSVRVIEIQYEPDIDEYRDGHIPGAVNWYWKDMLWHETDRQFPTPELMARRFGEWGISPIRPSSSTAGATSTRCSPIGSRQ